MSAIALARIEPPPRPEPGPPADVEQLESKMLKARTNMLFNDPFFGSLVLRLGLQYDPRVPTMATDGRCIRWGADFVRELSVPELQAVIAHEVLHCVYRHFDRVGTRNPTLWNIAGDYVINLDLVACDYILPKGGLIDEKYKGWSTEEVYRDLEQQCQQQQEQQQQQQQQQQQSGQGVPGSGEQQQQQQQSNGGADNPFADPGGMGSVFSPAAHSEGVGNQDSKSGNQSANDNNAAMSPAEIAKLSTDWDIATRQAAMVAAARAGKMPAHIALMVNALTAPRVNWRDVLRRFVDESIIHDWTWTNPNRRYLSGGLILPGPIADGINHIVVVLDTSGSIVAMQRALTAFASELQGILDDGAVERVTVVHCDAEVQGVEEYDRGDPIDLKPRGGGGTRFSPAFAWIAKHAPDCSAVVYFTDLEVTDWGDAPHCPVLWAYYGTAQRYKQLKDSPPFGDESMHINE